MNRLDCNYCYDADIRKYWINIAVALIGLWNLKEQVTTAQPKLC